MLKDELFDLDESVPSALIEMQKCLFFEQIFDCGNNELKKHLQLVKKNLNKGLSIEDAFLCFPCKTPSLNALKQLAFLHYYSGEKNYSKLAERLFQFNKTFSESRTQLETMKYSLFGGALLASVILGVMVSFTQDLSQSNALIPSLKTGVVVYLVLFSLISCFLVSKLERRNSFMFQAVILLSACLCAYYFFSLA
ncbi:hypothetical protein HUU53_00550 [Candidatus Micrarchaeota archaeon]|nr:hypothetical protein [Candidatus Micrarchaeota archaeon]